MYVCAVKWPKVRKQLDPKPLSRKCFLTWQSLLASLKITKGQFRCVSRKCVGPVMVSKGHTASSGGTHQCSATCSS